MSHSANSLMHPTASFAPIPRSVDTAEPDMAGATPRAALPQRMTSARNVGPTPNSLFPGSSSPDNTPPNPYLLASTAGTQLLSRRRLRLISRMFGQMCDAIDACHSVGISHRDLKPENFIVSESVATPLSEYPGGSGLDLSEDRHSTVAVKVTDWGLGSDEAECGDFDCGSKPYMSIECRNNLAPTCVHALPRL